MLKKNFFKCYENKKNKNKTLRDTWVAQLVEPLTLDLGSGHGPRVTGSSPSSGSVLSVEPAWDTLILSLSPPRPSPARSLSL